MKKSSSVLLSLISGLSFTALQAQNNAPPVVYDDAPYGPDTLGTAAPDYDDVYYQAPPVYHPFFWVDFWPQFDFSYFYYNPYWRPYFRPYAEWPYYYGRRWHGGPYGYYHGRPYYGPRRGYAYRPGYGRPSGNYGRPYGRPGYSNHQMNHGGSYSRPPAPSNHGMYRGGFGHSGSHSFRSSGG
ncbi:MAG: hypothetical protein ACHQRM_09410 [Bacteroidia bacterium]